MPRPTLDVDVRIYNIKLSLHPGRDDDLIEMLDSAPPRGMARVVMMAMREGAQSIDVPNGDMSDEEVGLLIDALEDMVF